MKKRANTEMIKHLAIEITLTLAIAFIGALLIYIAFVNGGFS